MGKEAKLSLILTLKKHSMTIIIKKETNYFTNNDNAISTTLISLPQTFMAQTNITNIGLSEVTIRIYALMDIQNTFNFQNVSIVLNNSFFQISGNLFFSNLNITTALNESQSVQTLFEMLETSSLSFQNVSFYDFPNVCQKAVITMNQSAKFEIKNSVFFDINVSEAKFLIAIDSFVNLENSSFKNFGSDTFLHFSISPIQNLISPTRNSSWAFSRCFSI